MSSRGSKSKSKSKSVPQRRAVKVTGKSEFISRMNRRQTEDYHKAVDLFEEGDLEQAEQILLELNRKGAFLAVIELLSCIYLETKAFGKAAKESRRLIRLVPDDEEARLRYASSVMFLGYATIAMVQFQGLLQRNRNHRESSQVEDWLQILTEEAMNRIQDAKFPTGSAGIRLQALHEESLLLMSNRHFEEAIEKCQKVLADAPEFCAARNNLALANFHAGNLSRTIEIAEEAVRLHPDNRFAAIQLAKFRFLAGNLEKPESLIEELLNNPPNNQDAAVTAAQWMAMAGYDEELVRFLTGLPKSVLVDPKNQGLALHYEAYGRCRLGQTSEAQSLWKKSLKILPHGTTAQENLNELKYPAENAAWPCEIEQWFPQSAIENVLKMTKSKSSKQAESVVPGYLKNLLPIFLDRGDPVLRKFAVALCTLNETNESMETLKQFALSTRGSDAIRNEALMALKGKGFIDQGPHRFFSRGKFREILLKDLEIFFEGGPSNLSKEILKKMEVAFAAMNQLNFAVAERIYEELLVENPENISASFNLASIWLQRDGKPGEKRARAVWEALHQRDPDYLFAGVGLANLYCGEGNFTKAQELLQRYASRERMHITEVKTLYATQAQIAQQQGNHDEAMSILRALESLVGDGDPVVNSLRRFIEPKSALSRLAGLFKKA